VGLGVKIRAERGDEAIVAVDRLPQFGAGAKVIESEIFGETADFMRYSDMVQPEQAVAIAAAKHEIRDGSHPQAVASNTGTPKPSSGAENRSGSPTPRTLTPGNG